MTISKLDLVITIACILVIVLIIIFGSMSTLNKLAIGVLAGIGSVRFFKIFKNNK